MRLTDRAMYKKTPSGPKYSLVFVFKDFAIPETLKLVNVVAINQFKHLKNIEKNFAHLLLNTQKKINQMYEKRL